MPLSYVGAVLCPLKSALIAWTLVCRLLELITETELICFIRKIPYNIEAENSALKGNHQFIKICIFTLGEHNLCWTTRLNHTKQDSPKTSNH